jgi:hypothetical protein
MTKARTAAQRRRDKRRKISLPGAEPAPAPPHPKARTQDDPRKTVLFARMRLMRLTDTPENRQLAAHPAAGCEPGRAILTQEPPDQHARLWGAVLHMARVVVQYDRACGAPHRHAQCLRILAPVDHMHADATTPPTDLRTPEERDRNAVAEWTRLHGWLWPLPYEARAAAWLHIADQPDLPVRRWHDLRAALSAIADRIEGNARKPA